MNKQEAVEIMATFIQKENLSKASNANDKERVAILSSESTKDSYKITCGNLYDVMEEQGLIVKP